jgi:2-oxoglutarate ferredoxin oxidoreductase subunit beta
MRRGVDMTYIVENNGVYGLTKGQFSATAERGSKSKRGVANEDAGIDLAALALQLGATYVARGFSGDKAQLVPLIEGAIRHRGASLVDVVSPCVAFNNHLGSTRSYDYVRAHNEAANRIEFVPRRDEITGACDPGSFIEIVQHDGSVLRLRKLEADFDPRDRLMAIQRVLEHQARGELLTGLLYVDPEAGDLHDRLGTTETPLNALGEAALCPGSAALERVNASLR